MNFQDEQTRAILEELKKRCSGYKGQLYELIKPIKQTYDVAVKVALQKCLRFLVVDTQYSAEYCTEFLKEKSLYKDLLILQNVPDKQFVPSFTKSALQGKGFLMTDLIECPRDIPFLEKAVKFFLKDKVYCHDFDTAVKLQHSGIKDIITEDGTEFKMGMISGGHHFNIFKGHMGTSQQNKEINTLITQISKLENELSTLKNLDKEVDSVNELT